MPSLPVFHPRDGIFSWLEVLFFAPSNLTWGRDTAWAATRRVLAEITETLTYTTFLASR